MIYIGCHLSTTDGYDAMGEQKRDKVIYYGLNNITKICCLNCRIVFVFHLFPIHTSYTMNLCSSKEETRANGLDMLQQDLKRMEMFPGQMYNFHPGSHTGQGVEIGIQQIADALNHVMKSNTTVLLETMAGKGSEVGSTFEELREIIDRIDCKDKIGVCFDTCHTWDAGYDVANDFDGVLERFDDIIGLERLKAVHFNDSKNDRGSHKDRHEKLGQGFLGLEGMKRIALHPALQGLPFILETPNEDEGYVEEIHTVLSWFE